MDLPNHSERKDAPQACMCSVNVSISSEWEGDGCDDYL